MSSPENPFEPSSEQATELALMTAYLTAVEWLEANTRLYIPEQEDNEPQYIDDMIITDAIYPRYSVSVTGDALSTILPDEAAALEVDATDQVVIEYVPDHLQIVDFIEDADNNESRNDSWFASDVDSVVHKDASLELSIFCNTGVKAIFQITPPIGELSQSTYAGGVLKPSKNSYREYLSAAECEVLQKIFSNVGQMQPVPADIAQLLTDALDTAHDASETFEPAMPELRAVGLASAEIAAALLENSAITHEQSVPQAAISELYREIWHQLGESGAEIAHLQPQFMQKIAEAFYGTSGSVACVGMSLCALQNPVYLYEQPIFSLAVIKNMNIAGMEWSETDMLYLSDGNYVSYRASGNLEKSWRNPEQPIITKHRLAALQEAAASINRLSQ